jgi:hypothetical protein
VGGCSGRGLPRTCGARPEPELSPEARGGASAAAAATSAASRRARSSASNGGGPGLDAPTGLLTFSIPIGWALNGLSGGDGAGLSGLGGLSGGAL